MSSNPTNPSSIVIVGEDFGFGSPLDVTLGDFGSLSIVTATDTEIEATLPSGILAGDYLLTVSTGNGQSQNDEYDLTIGAVGPQGPEGPHGQQGPPGADGQDGSPGPAGSPGEDGADGVSGWERVSVDHTIPPLSTIAAPAICPTGKRPLGGGWFGPSTDDVAFSRAEPDNIAFAVIVTNKTDHEQPIRTTVICATVLP